MLTFAPYPVTPKIGSIATSALSIFNAPNRPKSASPVIPFQPFSNGTFLPPPVPFVPWFPFSA
ncbi:hypothetical protein D3C77_380080 [compost metagenome]